MTRSSERDWRAKVPRAHRPKRYVGVVPQRVSVPSDADRSLMLTLSVEGYPLQAVEDLDPAGIVVACARDSFEVYKALDRFDAAKARALVMEYPQEVDVEWVSDRRQLYFLRTQDATFGLPHWQERSWLVVLSDVPFVELYVEHRPKFLPLGTLAKPIVEPVVWSWILAQVCQNLEPGRAIYRRRGNSPRLRDHVTTVRPGERLSLAPRRELFDQVLRAREERKLC